MVPGADPAGRGVEVRRIDPDRRHEDLTQELLDRTKQDGRVVAVLDQQEVHLLRGLAKKMSLEKKEYCKILSSEREKKNVLPLEEQ